MKGAFTGAAKTASRGHRFEQANGGSTIFLDEIAELPIDLQAKAALLQEAQSFSASGSSETVRVDLRIITATNVDLAERVKEGRFREDLFYRLNVVLDPVMRYLIAASGTSDIPGAGVACWR